MTNRPWLEPPELPAGRTPVHLDPLLDRLLARRGVQTGDQARDFLDPGHRHTPFAASLPALDEAVDRLASAIDQGQRVAIFGDYDADGITATAILTIALRSIARDPSLVQSHLPRRAHGYGLNDAAIDTFAAAHTQLLIAVDCGSSDHAQIAHARRAGMDVIVIDHHQLSANPPEGAIVVSTQRTPPGDPLRDLCAAGLAFLVVARLAREGFAIATPASDCETALLSLVALGTLADVMRLDGINRALVRDGLRWIRARPLPGIAALCGKAGLQPESLTAENVVFKLAPRLNAPGRLDDPSPSLDLLLATDLRKADGFAQDVEDKNNERRAKSLEVQKAASDIVSKCPDLDRTPVLVVDGCNWGIGLLGPVAAQLCDRYGRPVVVLTRDGGRLHGSARSVSGFDIAAALTDCADLLERHGGHAGAAGLSLLPENLGALTQRLNRAASGLALGDDNALALDADLPAERLTLATARTLRELEPHGPANERPVFRIRDVGVRQYDAVGQGGIHLSLQLATPAETVKAIGFNLAKRSGELVRTRQIDIAATVKIDSWNGRERLDLEVLDFKPADA